jgi:hypothetical protein
MILFLIAGTIILIYTLVFHREIPPTPAVAVSIAFGVILLLFSSFLLLYFLEQRKRRLGTNLENQRGPKNIKAKRKPVRFEECLPSYKKMSLPLRRHNTGGIPKKSFSKKLKERWDTWTESLRFWKGREPVLHDKPFNAYPAPTPPGYCRARDGRYYPDPRFRVPQPAETQVPFAPQNLRRSKVSGVRAALPVIPGSPNVDHQPATFTNSRPLPSHSSVHGSVGPRPASVG